MIGSTIVSALLLSRNRYWLKHPLDRRQNIQGGILVWGTTNRPTVINPVLTQTSVSASLMELIFDPLVRIDGQGRIVPGLANSWEISADEREYTFHLRKGVRFHDDIEFTAEDVQFTYTEIQDPGNDSPWRNSIELIERWEILDPHVIKMVLKQPFRPILQSLTREIAPKHLLEREDLKTHSFNYSPVGTGPFKLKKWDRRTDQIELEANSDYFQGRPHLDKIIVKTYPDNSRLWSALMRYEVDLVQYLAAQDYAMLKTDQSFKMYAIKNPVYWAIVYNLDDDVLADLEVRKAIAQSIDKKMLLKLLTESELSGLESTGPFHPESKGFNREIQVLEYDPHKARDILHRRGWRDRGADGILEKGGRELVIRLLIDSRNQLAVRMGKIIRQQLAEAGIKINILLYHAESELTPEYLAKHRPQAWLRLLSGPRDNEYQSVRDWYSKSSEFGRLWIYRNKKVDELFELGRHARDKRILTEVYKEIHQYIYEDQPACFLFFPVSFFAVNSRIQNTDAYFTPYMPTYTIKEWYVSSN